MRLTAAVVVLSSVAATSLTAVSAAEENWTQWRGPKATGVAPAGDHPVQFSSKQGLEWKTALPGRGFSTPAVHGDNIFLTCGIEGKDAICAYDFGGKERWRKTFGDEQAGKHRNGSGSNPSPATDGERTVVYFKSGTVACVDFDGNIAWQLNLQEKYGRSDLWWDLGTSPVMAGDHVIVAVMHGGESFLVALDLKSGSEVWKQPRQYDRPKEADQSYATPQLVSVKGRDMLVTWGADHLTGHDARTGQRVWECGGFNPDDEPFWRVIASAPVADDIALVPFARGKRLAAVRVDGQGDVTESHRLWTKDGVGSDVPTPVLRDGKAYVLGDKGPLTCLELATGDELWSVELPKNRNSFYASPVLAGNKLYAIREDGAVFVCRVDDDGGEVIAENSLDDHIIASPVPIRDRLLVRGEKNLYMFAPAGSAVGGQ